MAVQQVLLLKENQCTLDKLDATPGLMILLTKLDYDTGELPSARSDIDMS